MCPSIQYSTTCIFTEFFIFQHLHIFSSTKNSSFVQTHFYSYSFYYFPPIFAIQAVVFEQQNIIFVMIVPSLQRLIGIFLSSTNRNVSFSVFALPAQATVRKVFTDQQDYIQYWITHFNVLIIFF